MKCHKIILLLLAMFVGIVGYANPPSQQNSQEQKQEQKTDKSPPWSTDLRENQKSLEFLKKLSMVPVQFISRKDDLLTAHFFSPTMTREMTFKVRPDKDHTFFKINHDWEEGISRREFFKKFRNDFWLVIYIPDQDNYIYEAHQFKYWESLRASFAQNPDSIAESMDNLVYWTRMGLAPVYFVSVENEKAHWIFVVPVSGPRSPEDGEDILLGDGTRVRKRLMSADGFEFRVADHGVFTIPKDCVFGTVEIKNPRLTVANIALLGSTKARLKPVDKKYFLDKARSVFWICFYDKESKTLWRAIEAVSEELKNGNGKNIGNDGNGSGGKDKNKK